MKEPMESSAGKPRVPPTKGVELLRSQLEKAHSLSSLGSVRENEYNAWHTLTRSYLEMAFGTGSRAVMRILNAVRDGYFLETLDTGVYFARKLQKWESQLEAAIELLQAEPQFQHDERADVSTAQLGHRVFLVHGHDEETLHKVVRFLTDLNHNPIVLGEEPGKGRTIIEKFEECAREVGFVVVLLTPDDQGGPSGEPYEKQQSRARQNVVFELGYFIGKLGRRYVCPLRVPGVEIPSDYRGVEYIPLQMNEAWKLELAKEMKAADLEIDMGLVLQGNRGQSRMVLP